MATKVNGVNCAEEGKLPHSDESFVYILRSKCGALFKIGKSKDVTSRVRCVGADSIDVASSFTLRVPNDEQAYRLERYLHLAFAEWRVDKARAASIVGDAYGGLTEWFLADCLPRLDAILDHCTDLFPHERVTGAMLLPDDRQRATRNPQRARRERRVFTADELWIEAKPQIEAVATRVSMVIDIAKNVRVRDFGFGAGRLYGSCRSVDADSLAALVDDAFSHGGVKLTNQWIGLVTGYRPPSLVNDYRFHLCLALPGLWDPEPFSTRVRTYFGGLLSDLCPVDVLEPRQGWQEYFYKRQGEEEE